MLDTKFLGNRFMGSGEVVFKDGHGGHLGHVTSVMLLNFYFHAPKRRPNYADLRRLCFRRDSQ